MLIDKRKKNIVNFFSSFEKQCKIYIEKLWIISKICFSNSIQIWKIEKLVFRFPTPFFFFKKLEYYTIPKQEE